MAYIVDAVYSHDYVAAVRDSQGRCALVDLSECLTGSLERCLSMELFQQLRAATGTTWRTFTPSMPAPKLSVISPAPVSSHFVSGGFRRQQSADLVATDRFEFTWTDDGDHI